MKADLSRLRLAPTKHDEVWLEQQGRVRLDSDHNEAELARLLLDRLQASDVIGGCGVPEPGRGFAIQALAGPFGHLKPDFKILGGTDSRGHFYVDGVLCRKELDESYLSQTGDLPFPPPLPPPVGVPSGAVGWTPTGAALNVRRPMGISLANGLVLAVGGLDKNSGLQVAGAQIYSEATPGGPGAWNPAAPMVVGRSEAALVRLPDGRVLVTGGYGVVNNVNNVPLASCEIYDPKLNAWSVAASMSVARARHTATITVTGRVLVVGGDGGAGPVGSVEMLDPEGSPPAWTSMTALEIPRMQHVSAALPDDTVVVAGGAIANALFTADSVLFDFQENTWFPAGKLSEAKAQASTTVLADNRILAAGGIAVNNTPLTSVDVYDPHMHVWLRAQPMTSGRCAHSGTLLLDGTVLVAGGSISGGAAGNQPDAGAFLYDPMAPSGHWMPTANMNGARSPNQAALLLDGTVLAFGGDNADLAADLYHPQARGIGVIYLETWRRLVTQHQDPSILEPALNGTDTTARLRNVAQVKVVAVDESQYPAGVTCARAAAYLPGPGNGRLSVVALPPQLIQSDCELPDPGSYTGRENRLYRVEIHDGGNVAPVGNQPPTLPFTIAVAAANAGDTELNLAVPVTVQQVTSLIGHRWDLVDQGGVVEAVSIVDAQGQLISLGTPLLRTHPAGGQLAQPDRSFPLTQPATDGATSLDIGPGVAGPPYPGRWRLADPANADEDVEVVSVGSGTVELASGLVGAHGIGASLKPGAATFKWSRSNAAFAAAVTQVEDSQTLDVSTLGQDATSVLKIGDLVEVIGDGFELSYGRGQLCRVKRVDTDPIMRVVVDQALDSRLVGDSTQQMLPDTNLVVRRWDGFGTATNAFVDGLTTPDLDLGDGVHIEFGGWDLRPGDFWWFTTRAIDGQVELRDNVPPDGVERRACPLAILRWRGDQIENLRLESFDCRTTFDPLTGLQAKHVAFDDSVCAMGAVTVQQALDDICGRFDAADISYHATCPGLAEAKTVQEALDLLCSGAQSKWPTVYDISWLNDAVLEVDALNHQGLTVTTTEPMNKSTTTVDTFRVVLDLLYDLRIFYGKQITQAVIAAPTPAGPQPILGLGIGLSPAVAVSPGGPTPPEVLRPQPGTAISVSPGIAASPGGAISAMVGGPQPATAIPLRPGIAVSPGGAMTPVGGPAGPAAVPAPSLAAPAPGLAATLSAAAAGVTPSAAVPAAELPPAAAGLAAAGVAPADIGLASIVPSLIGGIAPPPVDVAPSGGRVLVQSNFFQRLPNELFGFVDTTDKQIVFKPRPELLPHMIDVLARLQREFEQAAQLTPTPGLRVRVSLKGDAILATAGSNPPLDGEVMGRLDTSGPQPRLDFARDPAGHISGGNGVEGGNFESWFFLSVPPRVLDVTPPSGASIEPGQSPVTSIAVDFTKPMDPSTITTSTFKVMDDTGAQVAALSVQAGSTSAVLTLADALAARTGQLSTTFTVILVGTGSNPIRDNTGLALDGMGQYKSGSDFHSTITVVAPTTSVVGVVPSLNTTIVDLGSGFPVSITFSGPVNPTTLTPATVLIEDMSGNAVSPAPASIQWNPTTLTASFQSRLTIGPVSGLPQFRIRVRGFIGGPHVVDQNGLPLNGGVDFTSTFTVRWPLHGTANPVVRDDGTWTVTFDKPLAASITAADVTSHVQITTPLIDGVLPATPRVTLPNQTTIHVQNGIFVVTFVPQIWWPGTTTIVLSNITDTDGYPLVGNQSDGSWKATITV